MFTFKEIYNIHLLSYQKTDKYEKGEPVLFLEKADFSSLTPNFQNLETTNNNGGNVYWDFTKDTTFRINKGIVSTKELQIFHQNLNVQDNIEKIPVAKREVLKTNELFQITLRETPLGDIGDLYIGDEDKTITKKIEKNFYQNVFCYDLNMNRLSPVSQDGKVITFGAANLDVIVYYSFERNVKETLYTLSKGDTMLFKILGEIVYVDEQTNVKSSCVIEFPKAIIRPSLSYQLGADNNFTSYDFEFTALTDEGYNKKYSNKLTFLAGDTIEPYV